MGFRTIAKKNTLLSDIMDNRTSIKTEDIIEKFGGVITLTDVDIVDIPTGRYPIFKFKEDDSSFYAGGTILMNIVDDCLEECNGDLSLVKNDLAKDNVKIKLSKARTKNGNSITKVDIL